MAMIGSERLGQVAGQWPFAAQKDPFPRHKNVIKDGQRLYAGKTRADRRCHFPFDRRRSAATDHGDARRIGGDGKGHRIVGILLAHVAGGQHDELVGVGSQGVMGLGAAYHDTVLVLFHHVQIQIGVGLLVGPQRTVALDVGHGRVAHQVILLKVLDVFQQPGVVASTEHAVGVVGDNGQSIERIHPHTALDAAGLSAVEASHLYLFLQVCRALVDVGEAIDDLAGQVRGRGDYLLNLWLLGPFVGQADDVDPRYNLRVLPGPLHLLAVHPHIVFHRRQAGDVLLRCFHGSFSFYPYISSRRGCHSSSAISTTRSKRKVRSSPAR
jgi:hypothetical protein